MLISSILVQGEGHVGPPPSVHARAPCDRSCAREPDRERASGSLSACARARLVPVRYRRRPPFFSLRLRLRLCLRPLLSEPPPAAGLSTQRHQDDDYQHKGDGGGARPWVCLYSIFLDGLAAQGSLIPAQRSRSLRRIWNEKKSHISQAGRRERS